MTKVCIYKDVKGNILRYTIKGHAGYAEAGEDIVCAAISILAHTTYASLIKVCDIAEEHIYVSVRDTDGYFELSIPEFRDSDVLEKSQIVFQVMEVGMKEILHSYPEYITLEYGEV